MKMYRLGFSLIFSVFLLLTGCQPSPQEAAGIFAEDLAAANYDRCARWLTPTLQKRIAEKGKTWPTLLFAATYYSKTKTCTLTKYIVSEGKAHTFLRLALSFSRNPSTVESMLDLVWVYTNGCWLIEDIGVNSYVGMLVPPDSEFAKDSEKPPEYTPYGKRIPIVYTKGEMWDTFGDNLEKYLETWYR